MLIMLKLFLNKWPLLTISLISLRIFWICEWDQFSQKLDIRDFNLSIRTRQFWSELSKIWFFEFGYAGCYNNCMKTQILLAHHSHQSLHLMHQLSTKSEIGSRFMIPFDPLSTFIEWPSIHIFFHYNYINSPLLHSKAHKNILSSPLLSSSEVE